MAPGVSLLRPLRLEVDENGEGCWVKLESFVKILKSNHEPGDTIVAIRSDNVKKEINGHKHGTKSIWGSDYVSYNSILRYIFHHNDQLIFCKRVCEQITQVLLGSNDTASSIFEIYKTVALKPFHNKHIETLFQSNSLIDTLIPTLFRDYELHFTKEEWRRVVEFEFHFYQRYEQLLEKMSFEEQLKHRLDFLQELQNASALSDLLDTQAKYTIAQRIKRKQKREQETNPVIVASSKHNPKILDCEILTYLNTPCITDIITADCTKSCSHDFSIHVFVVLANGSFSNLDIPLVIQAVRCYLEKHHSSKCDEIVFVYQEKVNQFISEEGNHYRFHLRDAFLAGNIKSLYVWKSNTTQATEPSTTGIVDINECSKCFVEYECDSLTVDNFNIIDEWNKSVPIHVQLLLESFINKDYVRRCEKKDSYIKDKLRNMYRLYDSLLHYYNLRYIGLFQERNTEDLMLNHKSLDTLFKITSDSGATVSLRLADHLVKKKANTELCYYNTYIKHYPIVYNSCLGIKTANLNLRECILTFMMDNLVKLRYHDDPYPGECRSQQLCTLPITVKGIPPDCSIIDQWHSQELCDGSDFCQCKQKTPIQKENYESFFLSLLPEEEESLKRFRRLYTWGFCGLWRYLTACTSWKSAMDRHGKQVNHETAELEESFASLTLSDGEDNTQENIYVEEVIIHEDRDTLEDSQFVEKEAEDIVDILKQVNEGDIEKLEEFDEFEELFPPLERSFSDSEDQHMSNVSDELPLDTFPVPLPPYANLFEKQRLEAMASDEKEPSNSDFVAKTFGFSIFRPPPFIAKHPPPAVGRDDDINKLKEILDELLRKTDNIHDTESVHKILFGPDQKIGENMLKLLSSEPKYRIILLEFPGLHLRKSRITNVCSAYKDAGLLHILKYMRDEDYEDWGTLISIQDINKATRYIRRVSVGLHIALLSTFMIRLPDEDQEELITDLLSDRAASVSDKWDEKYTNFVKTAARQNATFALHLEIMNHCDEICALALAERTGGIEGYRLLLAVVKSSLTFAFMNGASSYAPYCTQLLKIHYESGPYYQNMKATLFSTPHKNSKINFAVDCQREMDHKDVIKAFRSGSSLDAVIPRMSIVDSLDTVKDNIDQECSPIATEENQKSLLGLDLSDTDYTYIMRVATLVIRRGGLSTVPSDVVENVYTQSKATLPLSVLDKNTSDVGNYLLKKYIANQHLFSVSRNDLPSVMELNGPSELLNRVRLSKGVTIKRVTKTKRQVMTSERGIKEEKRMKLVAKEKKRIDCLSSEMNLCQAVVKPDCSKAKVQKSGGVQKALTEMIGRIVNGNSQNHLVYLNTKTVPIEIKSAVMATVEFAGIKFQTKAVSGETYMKYIENSILKKVTKMLPDLKTLVICEEKYKFTPDSFKAATRAQRTSKEKTTVSHLKTQDEILSLDKFDKTSLVTTAEGKCIISTFLAKNAKTLSLSDDLELYIDSELHIEGCECGDSERCACNIYSVPIKCTFTNINQEPNVDIVEGVKQRKGEAELAQIDWLISLSSQLEEGQPCVSFVTSGDIDALVLHLFTLAHCWVRNADGSFRNPVYIVLNKRNGIMDIYNITGILETFETSYHDKEIGIKLAIGLSLGGNDYLPRFHNKTHTEQLLTLFDNTCFLQRLFTCVWTGQCLTKVTVDKEVYRAFIKALYCPKSVKWHEMEFEEVRQISIQPPAMAASGSFRLPQLWMPPPTALDKLAIHIDSLLEYYLSAGKHEAKLPDFMSAGSLKKLSTGEIEYDLGSDIFSPDINQLLAYSTGHLKSKMKLCSKVRKRKYDETPQKGRRRKTTKPSASTPKNTHGPHNENKNI